MLTHWVALGVPKKPGGHIAEPGPDAFHCLKRKLKTLPKPRLQDSQKQQEREEGSWGRGGFSCRGAAARAPEATVLSAILCHEARRVSPFATGRHSSAQACRASGVPSPDRDLGSAHSSLASPQQGLCPSLAGRQVLP